MSPWQSFLQFLGAKPKPELPEGLTTEKTKSQLCKDLSEAMDRNRKAQEDLHRTISGANNMRLTQILKKGTAGE